jgi:hypothetical protein
MPTLSRLLGHVNPSVTQNLYVEISDDHLRKVAAGFEISMTESCNGVATDHKKGEKPKS